jgi:hypothetical protein
MGGFMEAIANAIAFAIVMAVVVEVFFRARATAPIADAVEQEELIADKPRVRVLQGNWIRWPGDADCPVSPNTVIETIHGNGAAFTGRHARYAKEWQHGWRHGEAIALDIMFFRIVR